MSPSAHSDDPKLPEIEALQALIAERSGDDPLCGAKLGSDLALKWLLAHLGTERGVHAETLMATVGTLMGLSSQASLWAEAEEGRQSVMAGLHLVRCRDDTCYLVGDPLNRRLMEGFDSPGELLREAARQEGCEEPPAGEDLLLDGIQRLCTPAFGKPEVPAEHAPQALTAAEQKELWLLVQPLCVGCCPDPREWPLLFGLLAARALRLVTPHLAPALAFRLAMDSAIDAARIPLEDHRWTEG